VSSWVGGRRRGWWALRCRGESQLLGLKKQAVRYWSCAPPCFLLIPLRSQGWLDQCRGCPPVSFMRHGDKLELSHVWWQTSTRDKCACMNQKNKWSLQDSWGRFVNTVPVPEDFFLKEKKIFCRPTTEPAAGAGWILSYLIKVQGAKRKQQVPDESFLLMGSFR